MILTLFSRNRLLDYEFKNRMTIYLLEIEKKIVYLGKKKLRFEE